jgi:phosphate transport system substrate-binding protein
LSVGAALSGCTDASLGDTVTVAGSTTILPIAEVAGESFMKHNPETSVLVSGMGSSAGIEAVSSGTADIGTSSRNLKDNESNELVDTPIAHDGIAVIVNPDNPISEITSAQLKGVYEGTITNWSELGGEDIRIDVINRDEASGTRDAFAGAIMKGASFDVGAVILPGTGQVREVVSRSRGAIGYISVGFVKSRFGTRPVKALILDGIEPTDENVGNGNYPISRVLHFFTLGEPEGLTKRYIEYVLSDEVQRGAVIQAGYLPVADKKGDNQ